MVAKLRPIAQAKGVALAMEGDGAAVVGDRARIVQVVTNLVENAVKYTGTGGTVRVGVWERDAQAGLSVRDTGPGIAAGALPRVFDRFFRTDTARSRAQGGSGLGLAICRWIVDAHGGRIEVRSRPGAGSTFSVRLPGAAAPAAEDSPPDLAEMRD